MAIYNNGESFYLNGVANPLSPERRQALPAHAFTHERLLSLLQIYNYSMVIQCVLIAPAIGYAFIRKLQLDPVSFETISVLAALISAPVFIIWISTLALRDGVTTFSLSDVNYQSAPSSSLYRFYALSGSNLFVVFISAPWGDGWHLPFAVVPPVGLFAVVTVLASHRLFRQSQQTK
ncbi:hypothetical protein PS2015_638 [Pseudohongiella spirulinae]|uniref:Uncharacterized protein n=2 Tax=Pseudohongiella spirulinae TaxID=1249552 RepID=A0A0S2KAT0_9GAMM|nr:hypothetical protein PS2015_638 [Pseudohongiella spirulinae]